MQLGSRIAGALLAALACVAPARAGAAYPELRALAFGDDPAAVDAAVRRLERAGVIVAHRFDGLLLVQDPIERRRGPGVVDALLPRLGAIEIGDGRLPARMLRRGSASFRAGAAAWERLRAGPPRDEGEEPIAMPPGEHAWIPPEVPPEVLAETLRAARASRGAADLERAPSPAPMREGAYGAAASNTSEYLAGSVSINLILVESDGSIDASTEDWTAARESEVTAQVVQASEWLRAQEPQADLRFVWHVVSGRADARARTGYEPIRRPADPKGPSGEDLWVKQILGKLGYASGDRFARSRAIAHDTRTADGTDWAFSVFVVDSWNDTDGKFTDGWFAWAWIGGPHLVMTYDNQSWGIGRMYQVARHETLHAFWAFDEYASSGCACADHRGYLDGTNVNCAICNAAYVPCVMIDNRDAMCAATRRQIGWADLDYDGIADVVGEDPDTFLDPLAASCGPVVLGGLGTVVAATNRNPVTTTPRQSIAVATLGGVEVRADGGAWTGAAPDDGAWGGYQERFNASLALAPGRHTIEARARDDHGNVDALPAAATVDVFAAVGAVGDNLSVGRSASGITVAWNAVPGAAGYRVYRSGSPSGGWIAAAEITATSWTDLSTASGYYRVVALDPCGAEGR